MTKKERGACREEGAQHGIPRLQGSDGAVGTRNSRRISAARRGQVHRSVGNAAARPPRSRWRSKRRWAWRSSLGGRPGATVARTASRPPARTLALERRNYRFSPESRPSCPRVPGPIPALTATSVLATALVSSAIAVILRREPRKRPRVGRAFPRNDTESSRSAGAGSEGRPVSPRRKTARRPERAWAPGRS